MRRFLVALVVAGLVASGSGAVAQASGSTDTRPALGSVLTPDQLGIPQPGQGFLPYLTGAGSQNGSNLGGLGLGGVAPTSLGTSALFGGCGAFSIVFCPFFSTQPYSQTFLLANGGSLGLGSPFQGLGMGNNVGLGGFGGVGGFGAVGGFGGLGFGGVGLGGLNCIPQGAFLVCR